MRCIFNDMRNSVVVKNKTDNKGLEVKTNKQKKSQLCIHKLKECSIRTKCQFWLLKLGYFLIQGLC